MMREIASETIAIYKEVRILGGPYHCACKDCRQKWINLGPDTKIFWLELSLTRATGKYCKKSSNICIVLQNYGPKNIGMGADTKIPYREPALTRAIGEYCNKSTRRDRRKLVWNKGSESTERK